MTGSLLSFLKKQDVEAYSGYQISKKSSIGIGGEAALCALPNTEEKLIYTVDLLRECGVEYKLVGGMTNVLPRDEKYEGAIVITSKYACYNTAENAVNVSCGMGLSALIRRLSQLSLGGLSPLYGIPGSLGGAAVGNAGALGLSLSDVLVCALVYSPSEKKKYVMSNEDMRYSYRHSALSEGDLILLSATLRLKETDRGEILRQLDECISKRKSTQPYGEKSLGSVFKRYDGIPVSRLIDEAGLKGFRIGGAEISEKHAGFIVNRKNATAADVRALAEFIRARLFSLYGIEPDLEIKIW